MREMPKKMLINRPKVCNSSGKKTSSLKKPRKKTVSKQKQLIIQEIIFSTNFCYFTITIIE